ncbi:DUF3945 domain-containing protein [Flavobacterium adhaerens]|uniref:DUF3945 domain-containing protein n=1 Tax=Flavobacterium adhaerens TaxID=3149043 RepID=UPI0032B462BC
MKEQIPNKQEYMEQLAKILLVLDKEKKKIQAVKSIDENGKLETVDPVKKNQNQFMKVDKNGDLFSNFFSNFFSQLNNPTNFSFFKIPTLLAVDTAKEMQRHLTNPTSEGEQLMRKNEIKIEQKKDEKQLNKNNMETAQTPQQTSEFRFKLEQIDWETMNKLGLNKEKLEKMNLLDPLLRGFKTNELVPVSLNLGTAVTRMDARLSLQHNDDGQVMVAIHGIRKEPNLNFAFFGHEFTKEDKNNLLQTGNMGRVVNLTNPKTKEAIPSIISVDRLTNELVALRTDFLKAPDEIKGVKLNPEQRQTLLDGKPLYLEGMVSKKGEPFNATLQFNADKRFVEFLFDGINANKQIQSLEAPKFFRGKELDNEQYQKLKDGQTVYLSGLVDKKGKEYNGYITFNKETNKTDFSFQNPNKIKEEVKPTEAHKTQTAVNSEGKTNESTKNIKEPLKSGQKNPDSKKQQEQQETPKAPAKSKAHKI